jgi:hypothetical protein
VAALKRNATRGLGVLSRPSSTTALSIRIDHGRPSGAPWAQAIVTRCVPRLPKVKELLSLSSTDSDGGGIRGLSELLILKEIMERIQFQQNLANAPLPCEYFDMIGGTSTGGYAPP